MKVMLKQWAELWKLRWQGWYVGLFATLAIVLPILWVLLWRIEPTIYREHGPMENVQVAALAGGLLILGLGVKWSSSAPGRVLCLGLGLFYLTFILLEFDTRQFASPLLKKLTNGAVRNISLGVLWAGVAVVVRRTRGMWDAVFQFLHAPAGFFLAASGFFWVAGYAIDKFGKRLDSVSALMCEELMECNAAPLMLLSAMWTLKFVQSLSLLDKTIHQRAGLDTSATARPAAE